MDIVDEFMSTGFEEEAGAAAWLVKKFAALEEARRGPASGPIPAFASACSTLESKCRNQKDH
jgi:hypothetical protein